MRSGLMISEIFYSIQGEGKNTGKPAVFVRLAGCNLNCNFCDTDYAFDSGKEFTVPEIIDEIKRYESSWVCITGGEPFLQDLRALTDSLKKEGFKVQIETNGTVYQDVQCDWLVLSPKKEKRPDNLILERADEIKIVVDCEAALNNVKEFEKWGTAHFVQPVNNETDLTGFCVDFVKANPNWQLSMQLHKFIGVR